MELPTNTNDNGTVSHCRSEDEKPEKAFVISGLTNQVIKFPNKSVLIADLIKKLCTEKTETSNTIQCHIMIQRFMLSETAIWNDMEFQRSRIVCDAECALDTRDQGDTFPGCGRTLQGNTDEVPKQAEQRISKRFIMYHGRNNNYISISKRSKNITVSRINSKNGA